ncbi:hypothetical protein JHK82_020596 [Glycine max]|nr:hypothetical protein JHK82_020596 [Glycine max]
MLSLTPKSSVVPTHLLLLLILLSLAGSAVAAAEKEYSYSSDLHRVLHKHGLPAGLFPRTVKSYNLDQTGRLDVHLTDSVWLTSDTAQGVGRDVKGRAFLVATCERYHSHRSFVGLSLSRFEDPPICRSHSGLMLKVGGRKGVGFTAQR